MNPELLEKLAKKMQKLGVLSLKTPQFSILLSPDHLKPRKASKPKAAKIQNGPEKPIEVEGELTPEQTLFWSSGGLPPEEKPTT